MGTDGHEHFVEPEYLPYQEVVLGDPKCICGHLPGFHYWESDYDYDMAEYQGCHPCRECFCDCYFPDESEKPPDGPGGFYIS